MACDKRRHHGFGEGTVHGNLLEEEQETPGPQGKGPLWVAWVDAARPWKKTDQCGGPHSQPRRSRLRGHVPATPTNMHGRMAAQRAVDLQETAPGRTRFTVLRARKSPSVVEGLEGAGVEHQGLPDGIVLAHGVDAGAELLLEVLGGRDEVWEHGNCSFENGPARPLGG